MRIMPFLDWWRTTLLRGVLCIQHNGAVNVGDREVKVWKRSGCWRRYAPLRRRR